MDLEGREIHVLAVDDSHLDRKVVERLLKNSCYKVTTVDSASRALEVLGIVGTAPLVINAFKINLIITDYCMPEMTGYDLLKKVKESSALKEIPVVIMSSENVAERITRCLAEGAKEFIIKPLRVADVKRLKSHIHHDSDGGGGGGGNGYVKRPGSNTDMKEASAKRSKAAAAAANSTITVELDQETSAKRSKAVAAAAAANLTSTANEDSARRCNAAADIAAEVEEDPAKRSTNATSTVDGADDKQSVPAVGVDSPATKLEQTTSGEQVVDEVESITLRKMETESSRPGDKRLKLLPE